MRSASRYATRTPIETVRCANLIGADGPRSSVRRQLGAGSVATYVTLQDFCRIEGPIEPYFDCIYMRDIGDEFGYAYVVPKGRRRHRRVGLLPQDQAAAREARSGARAAAAGSAARRVGQARSLGRPVGSPHRRHRPGRRPRAPRRRGRRVHVADARARASPTR